MNSYGDQAKRAAKGPEFGRETLFIVDIQQKEATKKRDQEEDAPPSREKGRLTVGPGQLSRAEAKSDGSRRGALGLGCPSRSGATRIRQKDRMQALKGSQRKIKRVFRVSPK